MRRIHYASGTVVTDDLTCKALLRYARALAENNTSDVVQVPVRTDAGTVAYAHFLIGPASQIFSDPVGEPSMDPLDASVVDKLEALTASMHPARPEWPDEMTDVPDLDLPELD